MPHPDLSSAASNAGISCLKTANACRQATFSAACNELGRIGSIDETVNSDASWSAMHRRMRSPFFLGSSARSAQSVDLQSFTPTIGVGNSLGSEAGKPLSRTVRAPIRPGIDWGTDEFAYQDFRTAHRNWPAP
jgi:hypothetical protein